MSHDTNEYDIGDRPTIVASFTNLEGLPDNPTAISFLLRDPRGILAATLDHTNATNPAVGEWRWLLPAAFDRAGVWRVRIVATAGPVVGAIERTMKVRKSLFVSG